MSPLYVTTTIPYVNARPHLGFALELVQADAFVRYKRLVGETVRFQTGTDDNALSNVLSARLEGVPVDRFVDQNSSAFRKLCDDLHVSHDRFLRTKEPDHHAAVTRFLSGLDPKDTYVAPYQGLYCPRCEDFYLPRDAPGGRCPEHLEELQLVDESNHFFRLSRYQARLHDLITGGRPAIIPEARRTEVLRFIESGLQDISISRGAARSGGWGVPFPGDPDQVVYVWIDALVNYLTGLGYPEGRNFRTFWQFGARTHFIGKNVWKFHAVYWPALLLSAGLDLPDSIFVHGFLTEEGRKISKSSGRAADPSDYVQEFGADGIRYYLLAYARPFEDTDVSREHLARVYRADLANTLGNLCSRLTALCATGEVPGLEEGTSSSAPGEYRRYFEGFRFDLAASELWGEFARLNREIAAERPWDYLRGPDRGTIVQRLADWSRQLYTLASWLAPLLPETAARIQVALSGPMIRRATPLFPRR